MKNLKKLTAFLIASVLCFSITAFAESDKITVTLDNEVLAFDVEPQIMNDRTMVPLRAIFEKLGALVTWDGENRSILSTKDNKETGETTIIMMQIDNNKMFINNDVIELDAVPVIVSDRTLVPLRAVSEAFGYTVDWNQDEKLVTISTTVETE